MKKLKLFSGATMLWLIPLIPIAHAFAVDASPAWLGERTIWLTSFGFFFCVLVSAICLMIDGAEK